MSEREPVRKITLAQFHAELKAQSVTRSDFALVCPMCKCPQSANTLIAAGVGSTFDDVERFLGFSCVGRWTGAGSPRAEPDGKPCNWTLGGLFSLHRLEVETPDGNIVPTFEPATPEIAQALSTRKGGE